MIYLFLGYLEGTPINPGFGEYVTPEVQKLGVFNLAGLLLIMVMEWVASSRGRFGLCNTTMLSLSSG